MTENEMEKLCDEIFLLYPNLEHEPSVTLEDIILRHFIEKHKSIKLALSAFNLFLNVISNLFKLLEFNYSY